MVDRLTDLLAREAESVDVPPAPAAVIVASGRRQRQRRTLAVGAAGVAAALVVTGGTGLALSLGQGDGDPDTAGDPAVAFGATFAAGTTIYYDDGADQAEIDDKAVKSLYYTSVGVVVRHGNNSYSDGGGPQRFSLVTPGGDVRPLSPVTEEAVQGSDPTQPYLVWATRDGGVVNLHVWDVSTDTETALVPVPGAAESNDGTETSPTFFPIALDGDTAYVGAGSTTYAVDWRSGDTNVFPLLDGSASVAAGVTVAAGDGGTATVRDVETGEVLLSEKAPGYGYFDLSPDGRFAVLVSQEGGGRSFDVYDVGTGAHVTLEGQTYDYGWTADGDLFRVRGDSLTTCDAGSGDCTDIGLSPAVPKNAELQLGGRTYES